MSFTKITFPEGTEIVSLVFILTPQKDAVLPPDYAKGLHAWFLDRVRKKDAALSQYLHDGQSEKAFSISRLEGEITSNGKQLYISKQNTYLWRVNALSSSVVSWMQQWFKGMPKTIALHQVRLKILEMAIAQPATTYSKLLKTRTSKHLTLSFITPTSFRKSGHHFPLPVPVNLFHSYLRRWNHFATEKYDGDAFLAWIEKNVLIVRHQLESAKVPGGKRGFVTGFVGAIELDLARGSSENPEYVSLYKTLGLLSVYCGTGHKTTFGLGQTRLGWQTKPRVITAIATENLLAERIEEIFEILMSQQKRTGGERATKVCRTRAIIMARRETGESISDIALAMDMQPDTVKSYIKLARRAVKSVD